MRTQGKRSPNLASRAALFKVHEKDFLVRRACGIRPAFVAQSNVRLVGRDQIRVRYEFLKPSAYRERERSQLLHLSARAPLECVPHFDG